MQTSLVMALLATGTVLKPHSHPLPYVQLALNSQLATCMIAIIEREHVK
jgi:hypothetical protein